MTKTTEYRVQWHECPTAYNRPGVLYIEAASPDDARALALDHLERRHGIAAHIKFTVTEAPPKPAGRVLP